MKKTKWRNKIQAAFRVFKKYLKTCLIGLDQFLNALAGGYPDETFSARAYRKAQAGQPFWRLMVCLIDRLFFWEKNHCRASYASEKERRHLPVELRGEI